MEREKYVQKKLLKFVAATSLIVFVTSFALLSFIHLLTVRSKCKVFVESIRNEVLLNDSRTLSQKVLALENEGFISISAKDSVHFFRERKASEFKLLDLVYSVPVLADTRDSASVISRFRFTYSLAQPLQIAIVINFILFIFLLFLTPQFYRVIEKQVRDDEHRKRLAFQNELARQVAHDIRAPLTALETALKDVVGLSQDRQDLLERAGSRIRAIAEDLLNQSRTPVTESNIKLDGSLSSKATSGNVFDIRESIIRITHEMNSLSASLNIQVDELEKKMLVVGSANDFERILSNLLQNSRDAVVDRENPAIKIAVRKYSSKVQIAVIDNGPGIPEEILSSIGTAGFSFGKPKGNGLGVYFAKKKILEWGGDFMISSKIGSGTMIQLGLVSVENGI